MLSFSTIVSNSHALSFSMMLCRTWCDDSRLSEDIDLLVADHIAAAESIPSLVTRSLRREFPRAAWSDVERLVNR